MYLLSLDLSVNSTGYSIFELESKKLIKYGVINPSRPTKKLKYPNFQLDQYKKVCAFLENLLKENPEISKSIIEEINPTRISGRISQKTLDGLHWYVCDLLSINCVDINYIDTVTWRNKVGIKLNPIERQKNKEAKQLNKHLKKGTPKLPIISLKDLAVKAVNEKYKLNFENNQHDVAESILIGEYWLNK